MLIFLFLMAILLGLVFHKSKIVRLYQYIIIYIVFVYNSWNQDDIFYRRIYEGYYGASHEPGFDLVCQFFYNRGVSYENFRICYVSIAVIFLLIAFHSGFKKSSNRAYSLILLYPLLPLVELLRNLMAISIVACGIAWYFSRKKEKIKEKIIFIFVILIGASFHYNVLFFLILLLPSERKPDRSTYVRIGLLSIASVAVCNIPIFRRILSVVFNSEKIMSWFSLSNRIGLGIIIVLAFHIISFWTYDFIYRSFYYRNIDTDTTESISDLISKRMYSLNVYSFVLIGLYTYNMEFFSRIYIFILLLNCFHVSMIIKKIKTTNIQILSVVQVLYHIVMFLYFCQPFNQDGIMSFVLRNNLLFP